MRKILLLLALVASSYGYAQNNVTFQVNMSEYPGTFGTIELNGSFNGWCGSCNPMVDQGNGIWSVTLSLPAGQIEYKYTFDNWAGQEMLTPGTPCTITSGDFTNRVLDISGDETLPLVCWESCNECTGTPANANVTFKVDLSEYTGPAYTTVNLNGEFNEWCGACAVMTDDNGDDIYELTVSIPTLDSIEYKFTLDGWNNQENLEDGSSCTLTTIEGENVFINRYIWVTETTVLPAACYGYCEDCSLVGLQENSALSSFKVGPNPSDGLVKIQGEFSSHTSYRITVTDIQGKVFYQTTNMDQLVNQTLQLDNIENGFYFVNIETESERMTEKIMIIK